MTNKNQDIKRREFLVEADVHEITRVVYKVKAKSFDAAREAVENGEGAFDGPGDENDLRFDDFDVRTVKDLITGNEQTY